MRVDVTDKRTVLAINAFCIGVLVCPVLPRREQDIEAEHASKLRRLEPSVLEARAELDAVVAALARKSEIGIAIADAALRRIRLLILRRVEPRRGSNRSAPPYAPRCSGAKCRVDVELTLSPRLHVLCTAKS
jgi:hypothetical protein